jgi:multiple sugar transport system permease protein
MNSISRATSNETIIEIQGYKPASKFKKIVPNIIIFYLPLTAVLIFVLLPFLWALSTSFKTQPDILNTAASFIPHPFTFENYHSVWSVNKFSVFFKNSIFISLASTIFILILSVANGYAISRYQFRGKSSFLVVLLSTQMMPVMLFIIPLFLVFKSLGLINTPLAIIIFYIVTQVPFNTLLMKGFIDAIPKEIDEAAMVDGAGRFRVIFGIIMRIILPGIVATSSFAFIGCWNEFLVAFSFITSDQNFTIPIGLKFMIGEYSVDYGSLAAGSMIGLIPPILMFAYIQKYLVDGLGSGSVKG